MNWNDQGQLSVHAVAEYAYCPRSAYGLLNGLESAAAATGSFREGCVMHEIVDSGGGQLRRGWKVRRSVRVSSSSLNLVGIIDQIKESSNGTIEIWEYKRGKTRDARTHEIQLAMLSLCYEESAGKLPSVGVVWTTGDRRARRFLITKEFLNEARAIAAAVSQSLGRPPSAWPRRRQHGCLGCLYRFSCWTEDELSHL